MLVIQTNEFEYLSRYPINLHKAPSKVKKAFNTLKTFQRKQRYEYLKQFLNKKVKYELFTSFNINSLPKNIDLKDLTLIDIYWANTEYVLVLESKSNSMNIIEFESDLNI